MPLIPAKCTQCGANIEVDNTKEAGICTHCGTAFVTEKTINNYNTYVTQNVTKNIYGKEKTEAEEHVRNADAFIKMGEYGQAEEQLNLAVKSNPSDWRVWFGMMRLYSGDFTDISDRAYKNYCKYLKNAAAVASSEELQEMQKLCTEYELKKKRAEKNLEKINQITFEETKRQNKIRKRENFILASLLTMLAVVFIFILVLYILFGCSNIAIYIKPTKIITFIKSTKNGAKFYGL